MPQPDRRRLLKAARVARHTPVRRLAREGLAKYAVLASQLWRAHGIDATGPGLDRRLGWLVTRWNHALTACGLPSTRMAIKRHPIVRSIPEEMGLRVQATQTLRPLDALLVVALSLSSAAWVWVSVAGPERDLVSAFSSFGGRPLAAAIGGAGLVAVIRSLFVARWPFSDIDGSIF